MPSSAWFASEHQSRYRERFLSRSSTRPVSPGSTSGTEWIVAPPARWMRRSWGSSP